MKTQSFNVDQVAPGVGGRAQWIAVLILILGFAPCLHAQTSDDNDRLKRALTRYPAADTDQDGVLTMEEARAYREDHLSGTGKAPEAAGARAPEGGERHVYKTVAEVELPLYVFKPDGLDAKAPAMVFFFGGGWTSGHPAQFEHHCKHLAARGMVAVTVEYRVSSRHGAKVGDCIEDAKSAMRWVRAHADELGVDPDRIAAAGGSAGGHLAACTAVIDNYDAATDPENVSAKPNAMVLFNPALGLAPGQNAQDPDRVTTRRLDETVIPLNFASTKQPPCIMFFGTNDRLLQGAELYRAASEKAGNNCRIVTYQGQGHGFFNHGANGSEHYELTVAEMDRFLVNLGWLSEE